MHVATAVANPGIGSMEGVDSLFPSFDHSLSSPSSGPLKGRKGIRPVKTEWWGVGVVIFLERGAYLHTAQLMPLPLTVSCFSKIQIGFTFVVPAHPGSPGQRALKTGVCILFEKYIYILASEMASRVNQHCASCIGARLFPICIYPSVMAASH